MFEEDQEVAGYIQSTQKEKDEYSKYRKIVEEQIKEFNIIVLPPNEPDFKFEYAMEAASLASNNTSFRLINGDVD